MKPMRALSMHGTSETDLFIVGTGGKIAHFDGTQIRPVRSETDFMLRGVWGQTGERFYFVGDGGTALQLLYDGSL